MKIFLHIDNLYADGYLCRMHRRILLIQKKKKKKRRREPFHLAMDFNLMPEFSNCRCMHISSVIFHIWRKHTILWLFSWVKSHTVAHRLLSVFSKVIWLFRCSIQFTLSKIDRNLCGIVFVGVWLEFLWKFEILIYCTFNVLTTLAMKITIFFFFFHFDKQMQTQAIQTLTPNSLCVVWKMCACDRFFIYVIQRNVNWLSIEINGVNKSMFIYRKTKIICHRKHIVKRWWKHTIDKSVRHNFTVSFLKINCATNCQMEMH